METNYINVYYQDGKSVVDFSFDDADALVEIFAQIVSGSVSSYIMQKITDQNTLRALEFVLMSYQKQSLTKQPVVPANMVFKGRAK